MNSVQAETFGKCGENLTWEYHNDSLYIDGSGPMTFEQVPWEAWKEQIVYVDLTGGCTSICANAFSNCKKLSFVSSDCLEYIGESAFENCVQLDALDFGRQDYELMEVADCAFRNCVSLSSWDAKVKVIGKHVFENCDKLNLYGIELGYENPDIITLGSPPITFQDISLGNPRIMPEGWGRFEGAVVAAYAGIDWGKQALSRGTVVEISVRSPFYCRTEEIFVAEYSGARIITARMLAVIDRDRARIRAEILDIKDGISFIQPVPDDEKKRLKEQHRYAYLAPGSGAARTFVKQMDERMMCLTTVDYGGDMWFYDYIYTDDDGIDHLFMTCGRFMLERYAYAGDGILGYHDDCPYIKKA